MRGMVEQQAGNLVSDDGVEFFGRDILILGHPPLNEFDDVECRLDADVAGDEDLFEVVEDVIINRVFAPYKPVELAKETGTRLFEPFFEALLLRRAFFRLEPIEKGHIQL